MQRDGAVRYLTVVTAAVAAFGALVCVVPAFADRFFGLVIFGRTGLPPALGDAALGYVGLVHGVLGAVILGWALLMLWVVRGPLRDGQPGAWWALTVPLTVWFLLDSGFSVGSGYWRNAVLNVVFYAAFLPGLVASRPRGPGATAAAPPAQP